MIGNAIPGYRGVAWDGVVRTIGWIDDGAVVFEAADIAGQHLLRPVVEECQGGVAAVAGEIPPDGQIGGIVLAKITCGGAAILGRGFDANEGLFGDDVDHAGHRIGPVDRRSAARNDLHMIDQGRGDGVEIDRHAARVTAHMPNAIDQGQGPIRAQIAKIGFVQAGALPADIGVGPNASVRT